MSRKKEYSTSDYSKVSAIIKEVGLIDPSLKAAMEHPAKLDETIDIIISKNYAKFSKKYGRKGISALLNFYIRKEEYEECAQIKKATS